MTPMKDVVTVIDVLEAGACHNGVIAWVKANHGEVTAVAADHVDNEWIRKASLSYGYGYGDGCYGYGYGYGYSCDGYGDGYGYGDGCYGDGYGDGDG